MISTKRSRSISPNPEDSAKRKCISTMEPATKERKKRKLKRRCRNFYEFSQCGTKEKLLKSAELLLSTQQNAIIERSFSQKPINEFSKKLVSAINPSGKEKFNSSVKCENKIQIDYITLQQKILHNLTNSEKYGKLANGTPRIIYEFNLLMVFLHDMYLNKDISFINFERMSHNSNVIVVCHKNRIICIKASFMNSSIGYSQLLSSRKKNNALWINELFTLFIDKLKDVKHFIIYTNAELELTKENKLKQGRSKSYHPFKFESINIKKNKYNFLRNCPCINENDLYRFAREEATREKLLNLLKFPPSFQKLKNKLSNASEKNMKEKFWNKLIFAVNQPDSEALIDSIRNVDKSNVPYNYEELQEVALRWSESHEFGSLTEEIMEELSHNIKANKFCFQKIQNKNINEEIKFARSVVDIRDKYTFDQFLGFLIKEKILSILKKNKINPLNMSSILCRAGASSVKAFNDLYKLWFDKQGNKTQYLKTLDENKISLSNMCGILSLAGANAAKAFHDLHNLLFNTFDKKGQKVEYLKTLEDSEVDFVRISSILNGSRTGAVKAFQDLYDLWFNTFDNKGRKIEYLKILKHNEVNIIHISSILSRAGTHAAQAFMDLYNLWFDEEGNKTQYLKLLQKEGIDIANISGILGGAGANAGIAFENLCELWFNTFNEKGEKIEYLKTLKDNGIKFVRISSILHGTAIHATKTFKDLYDLWFDGKGNETQYLKTLRKNGISLSVMSSILGGAKANAVKEFKNLYDIWFDQNGNKTEYLKAVEKKKINITNISKCLNRTGVNASKAFKELYNDIFNEQRNKHFIKQK